MMIEESETPEVGPQSDAAANVLAERRARHADPAVIRRADAAEAVVRNLETHLAALERRLEEVGRERERIAGQLSERESDVRNVKQREFVEQQLRVEAEQRSERLQREMHAEIQELGGRLEETERHVRELDAELAQLRERDARLVPIVRELMDVAAGLRSGFERELSALREELQQQVVWERETYVRELTAMGARMEDLRFELTRTADDLRAQLAAEPPSATLLEHTSVPESEREATHRREMADALVAAVERLRTRVAEVKEAEVAEAPAPPEVAQAPVERSQVIVQPVEGPLAPEPVVEFAPAVESLPVEPPAREPAAVEPTPADEPAVEEARVEPAVSGYVPAKTPPAETPAAGNYTGYRPVEEPAAAEPAAEEPPVAEPLVEASVIAQEPPAVAEPLIEDTAVEEPAVEGESAAIEEPLVEEPLVEELLVEEEPAIEEPVGEEPASEEAGAEEPPATEPVAEESAAHDVGLGGIHRHESPVVESPLGGLGPNGTLSTKVVTSEPVALQTRLLSVPEKRVSWLAPAIRGLAAQRDAKLAAELVIELLPAQRQVIEGQLNYEIKIAELGSFYVALDPASAVISREPRGAVEFSLEGSVAAFSELAAGGTTRRHRGLRIRKGKSRARELLKTRRQPIALADLAAGEVDIWPGLLLLAMAEAIDPTWTTGRRFELAFDIQDAEGIVIYIRVCDGEPILVSRTPAGQPIATISLSAHALVCLLAGTQAPSEHRATVLGDATSVDMFLQWTARAQGLSAATS